MRLLWWQDGLHVRPETANEREALKALVDALEGVQIDKGVPAGPIGAIQASDQQTVVRVDELAQIVP